VSVADRWHLARPPAGAKKCPAHRKAPSAEHGQGLRWQVRGLDGDLRPVKRNFGYEEDAKDFDAELKAAVRAGRYVDERAGKVTLRSRCELWWRSREYDPLTAERVGATFRNHVYEDPEHPGRTPRGSVAIGELPIGLLARQPSRVASWLTGLPLSANTKLLAFDLVSAVFEAAIADHIVLENPFKTKAVDKPKHTDPDVAAWDADRMAEVASNLPARWLPMPLLAAACGHRQGEAFAVAKSDIDWIRRTCRIEVQVKAVAGRLVFAPIKNDAARTVPIGKPVADLLSAHLLDDDHKKKFDDMHYHRAEGRPGRPGSRRTSQIEYRTDTTRTPSADRVAGSSGYASPSPAW